MAKTDWVKIADSLVGAEAAAAPIAPISESYKDFGIDDAYEVQLELVRRRLGLGATIRGHKIGLTSQAMRDQLGVDQPDFGHLFDDMFYSEDEPITYGRFLQPRVEPEIAFILGRELRGPGIEVSDVIGAVEYMVPALELIDSRIRDWKITIADTIADNASSGGVVIGSNKRLLDDCDPVSVGCSLSKDGNIVATGVGGDVMGNPLVAVAWLANVLGEKDESLASGEVILAGSLTASITVAPGDIVAADFTCLGSVSIRFAKEGEQR